MFGTRIVDRSPPLFQPRVAPEPEVQERLEEKIRAAAMQMKRRIPRHSQRWLVLVDDRTGARTG